MLILVIGPSGVGKSTALNVAEASVPECRFGSLDVLARDLGRSRGIINPSEEANDLRQKLKCDDTFLSIGIDAVNDLVARDPRRHHVIDVGAGFMDAPKVGDWFAQHLVVTFLAPAEVVHRRIRHARGDQRSLDQYKSQEFSPTREQLYRLAVFTINADCPVGEQLGDRLAVLLMGLVQRPL